MPKVLLVGNYEPDAQHSMLRFSKMLESGLPSNDFLVSTTTPPQKMGKDKGTQSGLGKWMGYSDKYLWAFKVFKDLLEEEQPDIVHICDHSNSIYLPAFEGIPTVITCHDLLAVRSWLGEIPGQKKSLTGGLQQRWIFSQLPKANHIACVSKATQADLIRLAPETESKQSVIPVGLNYNYKPLTPNQAIRCLRGIPGLNQLIDGVTLKPFILHVGNNGWYKNREGVVEIFKSLLKRDVPHVLVMAGEAANEALLTATSRIRDKVIFAENLSTEALEALYSTASCLLFPSLAEGFGWPPIEAQACGCPVVVSDIEPLRSNCSEAALYIDPNESDAAARIIHPILINPKKAQPLAEKGPENAKRFQAKAMIEAYRRVYQQLLNEDSTHR